MKSQNETRNGNGTGTGGGTGQESGSETVLTARAVEAAKSSLRAAREGMTFLAALTTQERKAARRLTPANLRLMEEALEAARQHPGILPASMDLAHFSGEVETCRELQSLLKALQELCSDVQDTLAVRGKEANGTTLQVRVMVKTVAKTKPTPGLKLLARRLYPRSARGPEKALVEPTQAQAPSGSAAAQPAPATAPATAPAAAAKDPGTAPPSEPKVA